MIKSLARSALSLAAFAILAVIHAGPARAVTFNHTYVSNTGSDGNNCASVATACATFATALHSTSPGGEITVVNAGNYSAVDILTSVSITNDYAGEAAIVVTAGLGISVDAGAGDVVSLRGLVIDGQSSGTTGIVINQASAVHIQHCVIRNFQDSNSANGGNAFGLTMVPSGRSQLFVSDTIIFNNGHVSATSGILIEPLSATGRADVVLDRVHLENNVHGLFVAGFNATGAGAHVIVRDSVISGNASNGIYAQTAPAKSPAFLLVERSSMVNNGQSGIRAEGPGATVLLKESTITRNGTGVSTVSGGQLISYGTSTNNNNLGAEGTATGFFAAF